MLSYKLILKHFISLIPFISMSIVIFGCSTKSLESTTIKIYNTFEYDCDNGKLRLLKDTIFYSDFLKVGIWYSKETFYKSINKYETNNYNHLYKDLPISEKTFNSFLTSKDDSDGIFYEAIQNVDCSNPEDILL